MARLSAEIQLLTSTLVNQITGLDVSYSACGIVELNRSLQEIDPKFGRLLHHAKSNLRSSARDIDTKCTRTSFCSRFHRFLTVDSTKVKRTIEGYDSSNINKLRSPRYIQNLREVFCSRSRRKTSKIRMSHQLVPDVRNSNRKISQREFAYKYESYLVKVFAFSRPILTTQFCLFSSSSLIRRFTPNIKRSWVSKQYIL